MRKLRELNLSGTAIMEVPPSIKHLNGLEDLDLGNCKNLVSLPESICSLRSLKTLKLDGCLKLQKVPKDLGHLQCLQKLTLAYISCELDCLSGLCSLRILHLTKCNLTQGIVQSNNCLSSPEVLRMLNCKVMEVEILNLICHLSSLRTLSIRYCNLMEGEIPSDISHLSSLDELFLEGNHFSSIPTGINQLSRLVGLDLVTARSFYKFQNFHQVYDF